jgi:hypothetical protein
MKIVATAIALLIAAAPSAHAVTVYHSPANNGVEGSTVTIPDDNTHVAINIWVRPTPGSPVSAGSARCSGDPNSPGDDMCAWDVHLIGTSDVEFHSFAAASGAFGLIDQTGPDPVLRVNGGSSDPNGDAAAEAAGVLMVSAPPAGSGVVDVTGKTWVNTFLVELSVDGSAGDLPLGEVVEGGIVDTDGDGEPDSTDNCVLVANASQGASVQDGLIGVGCACLCGDVNNSCTISGVDVQDIQTQILPNLGLQSGCYQVGLPDDQAICGASPAREVRGCDVNASATCSGVDAQVLQSDLPGIVGTPTYPLANGYDPTNCAQNTPDTCGDGTPCP